MWRCVISNCSLEPEDMYNRFWSADRNVNVIFAAYNDALKGDIQVMNVQQPEEGVTTLLQRAFRQFTMGPIARLMRATLNDDTDKYI